MAEIREIKRLWPHPFIEFADDNSFANRRHSKELLRALVAGAHPLVQRVRHLDRRRPGAAGPDARVRLPGAPDRAREPQPGRHRRRRAAPELEADAGSTTTGTTSAGSRRHGIAVNGCFVLGLDGDGPGVFDAVEAFVRESGQFDVQITVMTPFPGTPLYERLRREGRLLEDGAWERCSLFDVNFQPREHDGRRAPGRPPGARPAALHARTSGTPAGIGSGSSAASTGGDSSREAVGMSTSIDRSGSRRRGAGSSSSPRVYDIAPRRSPSWWPASRSSTAIGMELPPHIAYIQLAAVFIVVQGLSYLLPWRDAWSNEGVVWVGVAYKASYAALAAWYLVIGHAAEHVLHPVGHRRPRRSWSASCGSSGWPRGGGRRDPRRRSAGPSRSSSRATGGSAAASSGWRRSASSPWASSPASPAATLDAPPAVVAVPRARLDPDARGPGVEPARPAAPATCWSCRPRS